MNRVPISLWLLVVILTALVILKMTGIVTMSWVWVFSPVLFPGAAIILVLGWAALVESVNKLVSL